jgi:hypothetical protein
MGQAVAVLREVASFSLALFPGSRPGLRVHAIALRHLLHTIPAANR